MFDNGEAWYRNSILRNRVVPAVGYLGFTKAYKTIRYLSKQTDIHKVSIFDNSAQMLKNPSTKSQCLY